MTFELAFGVLGATVFGLVAFGLGCRFVRWIREVDEPVDIEIAHDPCEAHAARVVKLTVDASRVWPLAYVVANESGARIIGPSGSVLAYANGPGALDKLEQYVAQRREADA